MDLKFRCENVIKYPTEENDPPVDYAYHWSFMSVAEKSGERAEGGFIHRNFDADTYKVGAVYTIKIERAT